MLIIILHLPTTESYSLDIQALVLAILKLATVIVSDLTDEPELLSVVMLVHIQNSKYVCAQTDAMEIP
jgi:hypothetical protein